MIARLLILCALLVSPAWAVEPEEILTDPAQEAFAREVSKDLRCVVCQNQSIDDSDAQIARDMRVKVRELVIEGKTKPEIKAYFVARYGDYVLLEPPLTLSTVVLWFLPLVLLILAGGALTYRLFNAPKASKPQALSAAEQAKIDALLKDQN